MDDRTQRVFEKFDDGVVSDFLSVFGFVDDFALDVIVDGRQRLFSDLQMWSASSGFRGMDWAYLKATVIHLHQQTVDAARPVVALVIVAFDSDLCGVEHELVAKGTVDLSSVEACVTSGVLRSARHCDNVYD